MTRGAAWLLAALGALAAGGAGWWACDDARAALPFAVAAGAALVAGLVRLRESF